MIKGYGKMNEYKDYAYITNQDGDTLIWTHFKKNNNKIIIYWDIKGEMQFVEFDEDKKQEAQELFEIEKEKMEVAKNVR